MVSLISDRQAGRALSSLLARAQWGAVALTMLSLFASPAEAVMRGEPARDPAGTRRSTVAIETPEGICTGTIVGPDLVLTAGHCVSSRGRYRVRYLDGRFRPQAVQVSRVMPHPSFDPTHGFATDDVGLLQVARDFPAENAPVALVGGGGGGGGWGWFGGGASSTNGQEFIIAGFGSTERSRSRDGILREALMRESPPSVRGRGFAGLSGEDQSPRPGMCVGDSGGPVYRRSGRGFAIVGVLKGGTTEPGRECTSTPVYTPVAPYAGWISTIAQGWGTSMGPRSTVEMRQ